MAVQRLVLRDRQLLHWRHSGGVERYDVVALFQGRYASADVDDNARALVAEDAGEKTFGVGAGQGEVIGVADAGRLDFDQHLAGAGAIEIYLDDFKRFPGGGKATAARVFMDRSPIMVVGILPFVQRR